MAIRVTEFTDGIKIDGFPIGACKGNPVHSHELTPGQFITLHFNGLPYTITNNNGTPHVNYPPIIYNR